MIPFSMFFLFGWLLYAFIFSVNITGYNEGLLTPKALVPTILLSCLTYFTVWPCKYLICLVIGTSAGSQEVTPNMDVNQCGVFHRCMTGSPCGCGRWPWKFQPLQRTFWRECCENKATGTRICWSAGQWRPWMTERTFTSMSGTPWLHIPPETTWCSGRPLPLFSSIASPQLFIGFLTKTSLSGPEHGWRTCLRERARWCVRLWTTTALRLSASGRTSSCRATILSHVGGTSPDLRIFPGSTAGKGWQ